MFENRVAFAAVIATVALMGCGSTEAGVTAGTGGTDGSGGASGTGGSTGDGGASGTGGSAGIGGTAGESGTSGMGGSAGIGGAAGEGGASGAGGSVGEGGASGAGGSAGIGGAAGEGGTSGMGGGAGLGGVAGEGGSGACTTAEDCDDQDPCTADRCDAVQGCLHDEIIRVVCSRDADGDGFGWRTDVVAACQCPPGYILPRLDGKFDCSDENAGVNPGHTSYETTGFCSTGFCQAEFVSYNWDCSSSGEDMQYPNVSDGLCRFVGSGGFAVCRGTGWVNNVPDCGDSGAYRSCDSFDGCSEKLVPPRTQACR
jgi:hypothetical protein